MSTADAVTAGRDGGNDGRCGRPLRNHGATREVRDHSGREELRWCVRGLHGHGSLGLRISRRRAGDDDDPGGHQGLLLPGFTGFAATHHAITNHRIAIDGDHAVVRAHIHAEHWIDPAHAGGGPTCWVAVGFYDDEAVRTAEGWRLCSVRLTMTHSSGIEVVPIAMAIGQELLNAAARPED